MGGLGGQDPRQVGATRVPAAALGANGSTIVPKGGNSWWLMTIRAPLPAARAKSVWRERRSVDMSLLLGLGANSVSTGWWNEIGQVAEDLAARSQPHAVVAGGLAWRGNQVPTGHQLRLALRSDSRDRSPPPGLPASAGGLRDPVAPGCRPSLPGPVEGGHGGRRAVRYPAGPALGSGRSGRWRAPHR
jgi:hypothetical protein